MAQTYYWHIAAAWVPAGLAGLVRIAAEMERDQVAADRIAELDAATSQQPTEEN